ncbi:MAG: helix-turn-helix domain-containing protein [Planctomycetaceae bacterium]|nr:helix-turn-helix domain-containing protein [Planctomycetales bacterium]MCB9875731.1 helix-turn-helix domain-containing protein [Planctomycetaceae bacterium]
MSLELLTTAQAAQRLGISVSTLYDWLAQSNAGEFEIRGQSITIDYFQGGRRGQGRIQIYEAEIDRLKEAMRVVPQPQRRRRPPVQLRDFPGITVQLGRPDD